MIIEHDLIQRLTQTFTRSPLQLNRLHSSDAEMIQLPGVNVCLALTMDSVVEEIALGLYRDPYLAGWMLVTVNMSDLAAVGARPLGIIISEILPHKCSEDWLSQLQRGIRDACEACDTHILGGDTNVGDDLVLSGCAAGIVDRRKVLSRIGCHVGDTLYVTGSLGSGNAFALAQIVGGNALTFQPRARLTEGQILAGTANACMDTSDGVLATLDELARLNHVGFELDADWESLLDDGARALALSHGISPWLLLAGQHGEFELVFTVSQENENTLISEASTAGWRPLRLGRVIQHKEILAPIHGRICRLDTEYIRNLSTQFASDPNSYINELRSIDDALKKGAFSYAS